MTGKALSGGISSTLGANDPRSRRNHQAELAEGDVRIGRSLRLDDRQRLEVVPASDPGDPGDGDLADLREYVRALVGSLRGAGLVGGE